MVYGSVTSSTTNSATGNNNIDGLLANRRWTSRDVTYSFTSNFQNDYEDEFGYPHRSAHNATFAPLNAAQRTAVRDWVDMYESVSGLNLIELTGSSDRNATIRIGRSEHPNQRAASAYAYYPYNSVQAGDVWFDRFSESNPVLGNRVYRTVGHELGHALGLKHGHDGGGVNDTSMNTDRDSMEFSIMTYRSYVGDNRPGYHNETYGFAQSLMMYDIRAIQQMYGANFNHNSGNTTYTFSTTTGEMFVNGVGQGQPSANRIFRTIWDGNGVDTYNFSNYSNNLNINLAPGSWSDLDVGGNDQRAYLGDGNYARGHVFNALQYNGDTRSLIENAYGGSGSDRIYGNSANNSLRGNGGNDRIYGYAGNDTLVGGAGNDSLYGGDGRDYIWGDAGNDFISGGSGDDFMDGGSGNDYLLGGLGHDSIVGGLGDDRLSGTSYATQGTGERDILRSGSTNDRDTFILGENGRVFYDDQGNTDHAVIRDFDVYTLLGDAADRIQLLGSAASYSLGNVSVSGVAGAGIHFAGDLIGIIQNVSASSLNLSNTNQFTYV